MAPRALQTVLFQRTKPPLAQIEPGREAALSAGLRSAGNVLRQQREALGLDLGQIAEVLRIKPAYLDAIEEGRVERLPGAAYAAGFVRAYSTYLGLDGEEVGHRFRTAAAELSAKPDLSLPMPLGERSLPGGATLATAVILAICGYGAWYYLSAGERAVPEQVAEVPAALLPPPKPQPPPKSQAPTHTAAPEAPASFGPSSRSEASVAAGGTLSPQPAVPSASAPMSAVAVAPALPASAAAPPGAPTAAAQAKAAVPAGPAPVGSSERSSPGEAMASPAPEPQGRALHVYGADDVLSRIVISAHADSWIQIRGADGSILFTGLLKPGDSYRVPDRLGLSMRAGNAGGLDLTVDGRPAPSLGPIGSVRNLPLDPKSLAQSPARD